MSTTTPNPNSQNLTAVIAQVSKDKGIDKAVLVEALEAAIVTAAKKVFGQDRQLEAHFEESLGQVELFQYMQVSEDVQIPDVELDIETARNVDPDVQAGEELGFQIFYLEEHAKRAKEEDDKYGDILGVRAQRSTFGRIAAQTAKQVIIQRVREAERDVVYNEYKDRKSEIVAGIARRFEHGNVIVDLGRAEAVLPVREQMPRESYRAGDRVQAYVKDVSKESKGPQIKLSRTDPGLVLKLFEMEVPEIYEGIVKIVHIAREPGERTKIAVASSDSDVDPVGACVGMKGSRVQAVVQELRGEKIDIVPWNHDVARFVCHAIAPAEVQRVLIDEESHTIELIVGDDQLSLAIGRRGQNVRLASQLVSWKIEIHSESKMAAIKQELKEHLLKLNEPSLDDVIIDYIFKLGFHSPENILMADYGEFANLPGFTEDTLDRMKEVAAELKEKAGPDPRRRDTHAGPPPVYEQGPTPHDREGGRLKLVRGLSERLLQQLMAAGFRSVESLAKEPNLARIAQVDAIGLKKARQIRDASAKYLEEETAAGGYEALMSDVDLDDEDEAA